MEITNIKVRQLSKDEKLRAVVSVTFDNELAIHDIKIIEGKNGLFIAMPSRRTSEGDFKDVVHPIDSPTRLKIQNSVLEKYECALLAYESYALEEAAATKQN